MFDSSAYSPTTGAGSRSRNRARATRYEAARLYMCRNRSLVSPFTRPRRPLREKKNATMKLRPILAAFSLNFIAYSPELTSEKMEAKALVQQAGIFSRADDDAVQHQHYSSAPINAIPTSSIFICHLIPAFHLTGRPRSHESINPCVLLQRLTVPILAALTRWCCAYSGPSSPRTNKPWTECISHSE
ncbi:hypothetical protein LI328DRAFT_160910 [Trichoderma asperelloides]|nr:hypothetical protein LI328DRAFT_160910 [Trichoderma asperelloides]